MTCQQQSLTSKETCSWNYLEKNYVRDLATDWAIQKSAILMPSWSCLDLDYLVRKNRIGKGASFSIVEKDTRHHDTITERFRGHDFEISESFEGVGLATDAYERVKKVDYAYFDLNNQFKKNDLDWLEGFFKSHLNDRCQLNFSLNLNCRGQRKYRTVKNPYVEELKKEYYHEAKAEPEIFRQLTILANIFPDFKLMPISQPRITYANTVKPWHVHTSRINHGIRMLYFKLQR